MSAAAYTNYGQVIRKEQSREAQALNSIAIIITMPLETLADEELVTRYNESTDAAGRDLLINELFRRYFSRVARWCLRFQSDRELAADLAQEIFTKVYQNLHSFQGQSKFSTWVFSIARNHCLNAVRASARQATELRADVDEDFLAAIPGVTESPAAGVERESSRKLVAQLLNRALDDTERTVFTLHYGEEMPLDTITRMLGLENQSGAKAYIVSAKRKLARFVQQWRAQGLHMGME